MPMPQNQAPKDPARRAALRMLNAVYGGEMTSEIRHAAWFKALDGPVQARALRLADTVLRGSSRVDGLWQKHVERKPSPAVAAALRLGLVEVLALGAPQHAVVDDMVAAMKAVPKTAKAGGLVNAVLRKALKDAPNWDALPKAKLSRALRQKLENAWGKAITNAIERHWSLGNVPTDLAMRHPDPTFTQAVSATTLPNGALRLPQGTQISTLPGFAEGVFWVQDAAAQFPVLLSGIKAGDHVADLCAAPGGKTMQLAALGAKVTAVDISEKRLKRLHENLSRTGLHAEVANRDILEFHATGFDAVLLDAPCSATGTLRRHPELPLLFGQRDLKELLALQRRLLNHAANMVRPGGKLIYCTCSILPEEGEKQAEKFLECHPEFTAARLTGATDTVFFRRQPGFFRSLPHDWKDQGGMDGFFVSVFVKSETKSDA